MFARFEKMKPSMRHNVARLRTFLGFTQPEFAELTEMSIPTVQSVEAGRLVLSADKAENVSQATLVSEKWLRANNAEAPIVSIFGVPYTRRHFVAAQLLKIRGLAATAEYAPSESRESALAGMGLINDFYMQLMKKRPSAVPEADARLRQFLLDSLAHFEIAEDGVLPHRDDPVAYGASAAAALGQILKSAARQNEIKKARAKRAATDAALLEVVGDVYEGADLTKIAKAVKMITSERTEAEKAEIEKVVAARRNLAGIQANIAQWEAELGEDVVKTIMDGTYALAAELPSVAALFEKPAGASLSPEKMEAIRQALLESAAKQKSEQEPLTPGPSASTDTPTA